MVGRALSGKVATHFHVYRLIHIQQIDSFICSYISWYHVCTQFSGDWIQKYSICFLCDIGDNIWLYEICRPLHWCCKWSWKAEGCLGEESIAHKCIVSFLWKTFIFLTFLWLWGSKGEFSHQWYLIYELNSLEPLCKVCLRMLDALKTYCAAFADNMSINCSHFTDHLNDSVCVDVCTAASLLNPFTLRLDSLQCFLYTVCHVAVCSTPLCRVPLSGWNFQSMLIIDLACI